MLTVASAKPRSPAQYAQDTVAVAGFAHAIVLVMVCCCPQIIVDSRSGEELLDDALPVEDIVDGVCARSLKINVVTVQTMEITGQVWTIMYEHIVYFICEYCTGIKHAKLWLNSRRKCGRC